MKITLFMQENFEIYLIMSVLIYYKQLLLSVELKRSLADRFVRQYAKTYFSHLDSVTQENILHMCWNICFNTEVLHLSLSGCK